MKFLRYFVQAVLLFGVNSLCSSFIVQDALTKVYNVVPGEVVTGSVSIFNPTDKVINVNVSQADYTYNAQGESFFLEAGKYVRSNANWIRYQNFQSGSMHTTGMRRA